MLEQAKVPARVPAVLQPPPQEEDAPVEVIAAELARLLHRRADLRLHFGWDALVAVDDQDPGMLERQVGKGPVLLLRPAADVIELHQLGPEFASDLGAAVPRVAVHHPDLITEA